MTTPTKAEATRLEGACKAIVNRLKQHAVCYFDQHRLELLFSTPEELAFKEEFCRRYDVMPNSDTTIRLMTRFTHPVAAEPVGREFAFDVWATRFGKANIWPKNLVLRPDYDMDTYTELLSTVDEYIQFRADLRVYESCLEWVQECRTYEEMRYVFPPILRVFQYAGLGHLVNKLADVRKAPSKPTPCDHAMRKRLRHAVQWAAVQELLGRFNEPPADPERTMVKLYLEGNHTFEVKDVDGDCHFISI